MLNTQVEGFVRRFVAQQARPKAHTSGSIAYYYCRHCGAHTDTLPVGHQRVASTLCTPCKALDAEGLVEDALERAASSREDYLVSLEGHIT